MREPTAGLLPGVRHPARVSRSLAALALAAALGGCATEGPAYGPPAEDVAATVEATNSLVFEPSVVRIHAGETVEWRNQSLFTHTVTLTRDKVAASDEARLPAGAQPFAATLPPGQIFRHTFEAPGTYGYVCDPHESFGMHGQIIVAPEE